MNTAVKKPKIPQIKLAPCESSQIHAHGHCPTTNTLRLQFKDPTGQRFVYDYANFTADDYKKFTSAKSLGIHFGAHIKTPMIDDENLKHPLTKHAIDTLPAVDDQTAALR